jgi:hypothetical protein
MSALSGTHELSARSSSSKKEWFEFSASQRPKCLFLTEKIEAMVTPLKATPAAESARAAAAKRTDEPTKPRGKRRVSMSVVNFWVDATILAALLMLIWESATLQFIFPAPTLAGGWTLFGLTYDQCRDIQFATLCTFAFGILIHLMLHWNWVCSVIATQILRNGERPDEGMQTIYGVATLIVLLHVIGVGIIVALFLVHRPPPV